MEKIKKIIALAPHPDDIEFGAGGTVKKMTENGIEVWYVAFSPCIASVPSGLSSNVLFDELKKSVTHLGLKEKNVITYNYPVREFPANRQSILENLVSLNKEIAPDLVIIPNSKDLHQDHQVINHEGIRAFKKTRIIGYEMPWNYFEFKNDFHVKLNNSHLECKMKAINEYQSQNLRKYKDKELIYGIARMRGVQIDVEYAEAFECIKWII